MGNLGNTIIAQTPTNTQGKARVDLVKSDFDAVVYQKGYDVHLDRAMKCPCRNTPDAQGLSSCKNCGGSGWMFYNRTLTRMVVQSMNSQTKFQEWSQEKLGTARITALNETMLGYMDRVTLINTKVINSQVLFFKAHQDSKKRAMCVYPIIDMLDAFIFEGTDQPLLPAERGVDYIIAGGNWLELTAKHDALENPTISIRYTHNPSFHIVDINRNTMTTKKLTAGVDVDKNLPVSAVARSSHYVLDEEKYTADYLFDNSYIKGCDEVLVDISGNVCRINAYPDTLIPATPAANIIVFNQTSLQFQGWDGNQWVILGSNLIWP
jgi:hypothetical protein